MAGFPINETPETDVLGGANDSDVVAALSQTLPATWVSAVSYWCDYLTIIDIQELEDPAFRHAS